MQETRVRFLGREDPLEKEMATHFSIPCLENSKDEESGGLSSMESQRVRHWAASLSFFPFPSVIMEIDYMYWTLRQDSTIIQKWTLEPEVWMDHWPPLGLSFSFCEMELMIARLIESQWESDELLCRRVPCIPQAFIGVSCPPWSSSPASSIFIIIPLSFLSCQTPFNSLEY